MVVVDRTNVERLAPQIVEAVRNSDFVALDTEFTGLGEPSRAMDANLTTRYEYLCQLVATHGVLQVGLCCFRLANNHHGGKDVVAKACRQKRPQERVEWEVVGFDLVLVPDAPQITVSPRSLRFLAGNGMDLSHAFAKGVAYKPSAVVQRDVLTAPQRALCGVFDEVWRRPVVFHNGLLDLLFLFSAFIAPLPSTLSNFLAHCHDALQCGVFDTKHMASQTIRWESTYLEYVFHKLARTNARNPQPAAHPVVFTHANPEPGEAVLAVAVAVAGGGQAPRGVAAAVVCEQYARHGHCSNEECVDSHNINDILDREEREGRAGKKGGRGKKRARGSDPRHDRSNGKDGTGTPRSGEDVRPAKVLVTSGRAGIDPRSDGDANGEGEGEAEGERKGEGVEISTTPAPPPPQPGSASRAAGLGMHSALNDAFATGCVFVYLASRMPHDALGKCKNLVFLMRKTVPLRIFRSEFAKPALPTPANPANPANPAQQGQEEDKGEVVVDE